MASAYAVMVVLDSECLLQLQRYLYSHCVLQFQRYLCSHWAVQLQRYLYSQVFCNKRVFIRSMCLLHVWRYVYSQCALQQESFYMVNVFCSHRDLSSYRYICIASVLQSQISVQPVRYVHNICVLQQQSYLCCQCVLQLEDTYIASVFCSYRGIYVVGVTIY